MSVTIVPSTMGDSSIRWIPEIGDRTRQFVESRSSGSKPIDMDTVLAEAKSILGHCAPPTATNGDAVVLVVGYVQSGKTLSFTTLASLARDNGYGVVLLLAGTTNNLKQQSQHRLEKDLGLDELQRGWTEIFENPDLEGPALPKMRSALKSWKRRRDGLTQEEKPALVVSVLKHAGRINNAAKALGKLDLEGVPVLIIDDESDQATPNTKAHRNRQTGGKDESATYAAVLSLRGALPHHSFVQYTATPQANLLLATADRLNPDYAKVLSSGSDYTGGKAFFQERVDELVKTVPDSEIFNPNSPLVEPPEGLQNALRLFLLGIADANLKGVEENRSMMVQAHQNTGPHQVYRQWIRALLEDWQAGIEAGGEYAEEVLEGFRPAYFELARTVVDLEAFDRLIANIPERTEELRVVEVNSTSQAEKSIKWKSAYNWLLIGGMKLDRGFTVEGLTVTYMPRPLSDNADVLQQRARFFGYRSSYINYCRVYLLGAAKQAFVDYVGDEEFLRSSLLAHEGEPLAKWKRDFILHSQFTRPTRTGVIGRRVVRRRARRTWAWPKSMHVGSDVRLANHALFAEAQSRLRETSVDAAALFGAVDRRASGHNLASTGVSLEVALDFLMRVRVATIEDSLLLSALTMQLARVVRYPQDGDPTTAAFVFMRNLDLPEGAGRKLSVVRENIHTGMNPTGATGRDVIYSGDDAFRSQSELTIQLRTMRLSDPAPSGEDYSSVPWLAVRVPNGISRDLFVDLD
ncbi:Z1 domain-containing protein [Arthrobacter sp. MDT2-2]